MSAMRVVPTGELERERRAARRTRFTWIAGAALLTLALTVQPFRDTDVWWHLALGQLITTHGIPAHEPFSFLPAAYPWVGQQWLYEVLLAGLVGAGGAALASAVMGAVAVVALVTAALAVPRSARVGGVWLAVAILLSGLVMAQVVGVRGQVISLAGVAAVLFVVARWREGRTGFVWLLPALFLVWANMHAGFIVGLAILALALPLARALPPATAIARKPLAAALGLSLVATLVNPAGIGLYGYVAETFMNPTITQVVTEWMSPDFHNVWVQLFEAEAILLVVLWVIGGGPDRFDAVLAVGALAATLQAQRNVSLFALIAVPQIALYGSRARRLRMAPRLHARRTSTAPRAASLIAVAAITAVTAAVATTVVPRLTPSASAAFESSRYPKTAADYVAAHFAHDRLYTADSWGGYLAFRFPQGRVVFLYDETAIFGSAALQRYLDVHLLRKDWATVLSSESVHHAIVGDSSQEAAAFHEIGWTIDCHDATSGSLVMTAPVVPPSKVSSPLAVPTTGVTAC
jgi:hypothetical protein